MSQNAEILTRLNKLMDALPNANLSARGLEMYERALVHVPLKTLDAALSQGMLSWKFFPSVAEIFDQCMKLDSPTSLLPTAGEAWGSVVDEIHRTGYYKTPHFDCELISRAVECMDWKYLCSSEDQMADRAHFMKIYDQLKVRAEQDARLLPQSLAMRERMRVQPRPEELKQIKTTTPELIAAPSEVIEIIQALTGKFSMPVEVSKPESNVVEMPLVKMECSKCGRKTNSRMGWVINEGCQLPIDGILCDGVMVVRA